MTDANGTIGWLGRAARAVSLGCLSYWGVYAVLAPVTTVDAHMYNAARIVLAARGGLFENPYFTSVFHVVFPWTFDALQLPFLALGWGYALPSFLCLAGTCHVVLTLTRARLGADAGWVAVLGLLSLTCFVYQATAVKNDIPLVFAGACWLYAMARWRAGREGVHLFWMVVALGLMAGSKTTGVPFACAGGVVMLWQVRRDRRLLARVAAGLVGSAVLLGSVETYVEAMRIYGNPLGPRQVIESYRNPDGVAGAAANFSRHLARGIYVGPASSRNPASAAAWLSGRERALLAASGLTDKGNDPRFPDEGLFLFQSGLEEFAGFGPVGTTAFLMMLATIFVPRPSRLSWRLAVAGLGVLLVLSWMVAYTDWASRYVMGAYVLATTAVVCWLWERETRWRRVLRVGFAGIAATWAVAAPMLSFNRGPSALVEAVRDREKLETSAVPVAGAVRDALRRLRLETPGSRVYVVAGNDSIVLPYLEDDSIAATLVTPPTFERLAERGVLAAGDIVVEDVAVLRSRLVPVAEVSAPDVYSRGGRRSQVIYRFGPWPPPARR